MKRFRITIRWRSYRWRLNGIARSSCDMLAGVLDHVPPYAMVSVNPDFTVENNYAEYMIRRDQLARWEGR